MTLPVSLLQRGQTELKTRRLLTNTKALSPVIATIILVAVTVAIAIAVAAWLGALTFTYTRTEQLTITQVTFNNASQVTFSIANSGTSDVTISTAMVQGSGLTGSPSVTLTANNLVPKGGTLTLVVNFQGKTGFTSFASGARYDFTLVSTQGNKFPTSAIR